MTDVQLAGNTCVVKILDIDTKQAASERTFESGIGSDMTGHHTLSSV